MAQPVFGDLTPNFNTGPYTGDFDFFVQNPSPSKPTSSPRSSPWEKQEHKEPALYLTHTPSAWDQLYQGQKAKQQRIEVVKGSVWGILNQCRVKEAGQLANISDLSDIIAQYGCIWKAPEQKLNRDFHYHFLLLDLGDEIQHVANAIAGYATPKDFVDALRKILYRIENAVKRMLSMQSDYQIAAEDIQKSLSKRLIKAMEKSLEPMIDTLKLEDAPLLESRLYSLKADIETAQTILDTLIELNDGANVRRFSVARIMDSFMQAAYKKTFVDVIGPALLVNVPEKDKEQAEEAIASKLQEIELAMKTVAIDKDFSSYVPPQAPMELAAASPILKPKTLAEAIWGAKTPSEA